MQLIFLGTAAAEGYPDAFCDCLNCEQARVLGGKSLRKRSSLLINDDFLIDLGPDLLAAAQIHRRSLASVRYCVQTHGHDDHLDPSNFFARSTHCGVVDAPLLHFYGSSRVIGQVARSIDPLLPTGQNLDPGTCAQLHLELHEIKAAQACTIGPYQVFAVSAAHDPASGPLLYVIERDGSTLFYATDTGPLPEESWQALRRQGVRFDLVVLDHTFGSGAPSDHHLNAEQFLAQVTRMRAEGLLAKQARIFAHHLAHHSNPTHPELVKAAQQHGYEVAYDGLIL